MKVIKKNVYYCDFCKKKSLRSLRIHEKHCTANSDRECRLCDNKSIKPIIEKYKELFTIKEIKAVYLVGMEQEWEEKVIFKKEFTLKDIVNELDYICPNCILAIIRCVGLNRYYFKKKFKFDYEKALDNWWKATNKEAYEKEQREMYYV